MRTDDVRDSFNLQAYETCPCQRRLRWLEDAEEAEDDDLIVWQVVYTCIVLFGMLAALLSDRVGADSVMLCSVTAFMVSNIITVQEGVEGFANEGVLTVLVLFVVAEGINKTGALDWYMGKLLGRPATPAGAQLKLMAPIAVVSAFLNNTPVVAVMIPIVQRWSKNIRVHVQQLLIPLSFASILGGTCTLIGTSTNLVVYGLLQDRYPDDPSIEIGIFDLGEYGVPVAFAGAAYILVAAPFLLPGGRSRDSSNQGAIPMDSQEDVLLGARLTPWSPAAGRSVKRSGLRDTGGIYLVSVIRAATGNVHRAVGQEFVLNAGDILYFTGLVVGFGEFCAEHGLEVLTNETSPEDLDVAPGQEQAVAQTETAASKDSGTTEVATLSEKVPIISKMPLSIVPEGEEDGEGSVPFEVGLTKESLLRADEAERSRTISRLTDLIRGTARDEPMEEQASFRRIKRKEPAPGAPQVVVTSDHEYVVIGVNAADRPGLLLDISKGLLRLNLSLRHTEAAVVGARSVSIWRCELIDSEIPDLEEIWSVLNALMENEQGTQAAKKRGLQVIRAVVTKGSNLIGKTPVEADFRMEYKAAIVAVQKGGKNVTLSGVRFGPGDVLVLQANDDSALLRRPPKDFYKRQTENKGIDSNSRTNSVSSFVNRLKGFSNAVMDKDLGHRQASRENLEAGRELNDEPDESPRVANRTSRSGASQDDDDYFIPTDDEDEDLGNMEENVEISGTDMVDRALEEKVWNDLQVHFEEEGKEESGSGGREFLAAMQIKKDSGLAGQTAVEIGLDKLSGVYLVSIDRPTSLNESNVKQKPKVTVVTASSVVSADGQSSFAGDDSIVSMPTVDPVFKAISPDMPLQEGDVLWFAGSANAVGDLRKVPGLVSYESGEVAKLNEDVHDRRLVEAVVARRGPLVGQTVKEVRFRTRFGAAVIAVHRDGNRVHEHPGKVKLQAGDVLLLEAGPTFIKKSVENNRSFALLAEVKDSAPPRLRLLLPALLLTAGMLLASMLQLATLFECGLVASILMVMLGILSEQEARDAINWEVYITIASAFGIGTALVNSGVAGALAIFLVDVGEAMGIGDAGLLGAVYFATFLISNVVTNNAAAALIFPIALDAAEQTGIDRKLMSFSVMLGASASFMSPFGYTTNIMIYGPGGYKYKDFLVMGTPMQIVLWILSTTFLSTTETVSWWINWLATAGLLALVVGIRIFNFSPSSINLDISKHPQ